MPEHYEIGIQNSHTDGFFFCRIFIIYHINHTCTLNLHIRIAAFVGTSSKQSNYN